MFLNRTCLVDGKEHPPGTPLGKFRKGTVDSLKSAGWVTEEDPTKPAPKKAATSDDDKTPAKKKTAKKKPASK